MSVNLCSAARRLPLWTAVLLLSSPVSTPALGHNPLTGSTDERAAGIASAALLVLLWFFYWRGSRRVQPRWQHRLLFHSTFVLCALTVLGPLDDWAKTSTAAHMTQHMLLIVVIAPLWVLSRPLAAIRSGGGQLMSSSWRWLWKPFLRIADRPMTAAYLHGFMIWFWHMPYFYMLAVDNPWWHTLEHACFLATACLFWLAVFTGSRRRLPWALIALLFTLMHTGFLGAILTFAGNPLYGEARSLQDQQLAGLIMWITAAIPYLLAAAWVGNRWYQRLMRSGQLGK